jgi:FLVCR family MFS transporter
MYISGIVGGCLLNAPIPLFFELALEVSFPEIPEARAAGSISLLNNTMQVLFLAAMSFAGSGE